MEYDCIEIERRLAIGFNDYLSLAQRSRYVASGMDLEQIAKTDERFRLYRRETRDVIHWLSQSRDNSIIWHGDEEFPSFNPLRSHLPFMLLCTGERPQAGIKCAAIVGTRHATYAGIQEAFRFGMEATQNRIRVISGFAEGIDQGGMNGAIAGGGPCIGVLACGHNIEYPALTMGIRKRILDSGGCILSRFPPDHVSYKSNFISRNMVIAAYCSFVIAVQAPGRSGTLSTCDFATHMGKDVYVGSQGIGDRFVQAGTSNLFRDGAKVITSLTDGSVADVEIRFHVTEAEEDESDVFRYGDRCYVVQSLIG
ncbi:MAG: DNA-processing protein DprA [Spirochaetales bacterium]|nr:DNA-processing protein DprA [Spirochaetales bacterium]